MEQFAYDRDVPLEVQYANSSTDQVAVHDLWYSSPRRGRVTAYLVEPVAAGKFPTAIFLHGGGQDRCALFPEARDMALNGWVCLSLDAPFARPEPDRRHIADFTDPENDREVYVQSVVDVRRAVDLLETRDNVDGRRVAYIGLSFGATVGVIIAAHERRIRRLALVAPVASMSELWRSHNPTIENFRRGVSPAQLDAYIAATREFDALNYIAEAGAGRLFLQFADRDEITTRQASERLAEDAPAATLVRWYDTTHQFACAEARDDRTAWLKAELAPPAV